MSQAKNEVTLKLVVEIDGKSYPIKTVTYTDMVNVMIKDGVMETDDSDIVEYITDQFYDGDSGI
jgi:hypothetical protein